jgi:hypothetical protein
MSLFLNGRTLPRVLGRTVLCGAHVRRQRDREYRHQQWK